MSLGVDPNVLIQKVDQNTQLQKLYGVNTGACWESVKTIFGYPQQSTDAKSSLSHDQLETFNACMDAGAEDDAVAHLKAIAEAEASSESDDMDLLCGTWGELWVKYSGDIALLTKAVEDAVADDMFQSDASDPHNSEKVTAPSYLIFYHSSFRLACCKTRIYTKRILRCTIATSA